MVPDQGRDHMHRRVPDTNGTKKGTIVKVDDDDNDEN
jgi:hypothetical protein